MFNPISLIQSLTSAGEKVLDTFVTNKNDRAKAGDMMAMAVLKSVSDENKGQMEVNKVEAGHRSVFVAGWRPYIGWVCGAGVTWSFVLRPVVEFVLVVNDIDIGKLPEVNTVEIMGLLSGMLGLGTLRTYEKKKGLTL